MNSDCLAVIVTLFKVIAFQHAGHCLAGGQLNHASSAQLIHPFRIKPNLCALRIQNFEHLFLIRLRVFQYLFFAQGLACHIFTCRIANKPGEITDQKNDFVTKLLEHAQLVD